jgi:trehalose/maltose transport system permease protein
VYPRNLFMTLKRYKKIQRCVFFYSIILLIAIYLLFPIAWALLTALKTEAEAITQPATIFPLHPTLANFKAVFLDAVLMRSLWNSTLVATLTTLLSLTIGSFAAYALGKLRFRFRTPMLYSVLAMTTFPAVTLLSGLYSVNRILSDIDAALPWISLPTQAVLVAIYMIFALPFTIWTLSYFFKSLPDSLLQAARVDGATHWQILWLVIFPLARPALASAGLLTFLASWNEYLFALTFTLQSPNMRTVPVAITSYYDLGTPIGQVMAAGIIVILPTLILVLVFQHYIVAGLTVGAVKG